MIFKYLSTILTVLLSATSLSSAPIGDSYTISMPLHIDLSDSGSFNVELVDSNLSNNDSIELHFDDSFILKDIHGKPDITGNITNGYVCFNQDNQNSKTVYYTVNNASVGQWNGNLNVSISLNRKQPSNALIDGNSINQILTELNPTTISFSHENINGNYLYDLSTAQDESILLYMNGSDAIITNKQDIPIIANQDMSSTFRFLNVTAINNLDYIDMSNCTNTSKMFEWAKNVISLDVGSMNTSNVTDMSSMFENMHACTTIIGLENFDVSNVTSIAHLLSYDIALSTIPNLGGWNITNKCKDISYAFNSIGYTASKNNTSKWLDTITYDYSNWDVSNVENMSHAFANAFKLKTLDLSGWDTSNVTDMSYMFDMTDSINKSYLATIYGLADFDVSNVTNMDYMFHECRSLSADLSSWNPISLLTIKHCYENTRNLDIRPLENWTDIIVNNNVNYENCFDNFSCYSIQRNFKPSWYK